MKMNINIIDESTILDDDYIDENKALAYLLLNDIVFLNNIDLSKSHSHYYDKPTYTTVVYVLCSDVFSYCCADAECISSSDGGLDSEIYLLYKYCKENPYFGHIKFCALKRKMRPLKEIVERMKNADYWCDELEKLNY
jgi:hypothetical protein